MAEPVELSDEVKAFIVSRLACWQKPTEVVKAVKESFGVDVTPQRVKCNDPTKVAGKHLSVAVSVAPDTPGTPAAGDQEPEVDVEAGAAPEPGLSGPVDEAVAEARPFLFAEEDDFQ